MIVSLDTNILLYAVVEDCPEFPATRELVDGLLEQPETVVIADQVWFELYRHLRNPRVVARPLAANEAASLIDWYRNRSGWGRCAWDIGLFDQILPVLAAHHRAPRHVFDLVLAATLRDAGITRFYTRNARDFAQLDWFEIDNPIDRDA